VIRGNTQGPRNCNRPTVSYGRGANIAAIRGNTQGAEITWGWGAKMSRRAEGGGGTIKTPYFNTLDGLWFMFSWWVNICTFSTWKI